MTRGVTKDGGPRKTDKWYRINRLPNPRLGNKVEPLRPNEYASIERVNGSFPPVRLADAKASRALVPYVPQLPEMASTVLTPIAEDNPGETDEQIDQRIAGRFALAKRMTKLAIAGKVRFLLISGAPGLGKTEDVDQLLLEAGIDAVSLGGKAAATGLYRTLFRNRKAGKITYVDDCDALLRDETALDIFKRACDTGKRRWISWGTEAVENWFDDTTGEPIPRQFEFEGSVIIITNLDLEDLKARSAKLAPYISAIQSRGMHIDMGIRTRREMFIRIKQVVLGAQMLRDKGLSESDDQKILDFLRENLNGLKEVSLRTVLKVAVHYLDGETWQEDAKGTCCW